MNKWVAEFELEDGDIMPKHMDLNYKGAKIDFHCKPLEQEHVLDKIRAEIEQKLGTHGYVSLYNRAIYDVLMIVDKYKAESEVEDGNNI